MLDIVQDLRVAALLHETGAHRADTGTRAQARLFEKFSFALFGFLELGSNDDQAEIGHEVRTKLENHYSKKRIYILLIDLMLLQKEG